MPVDCSTEESAPRMRAAFRYAAGVAMADSLYFTPFGIEEAVR